MLMQKKFNKSDVRDIYVRLESSGIYYTISHLERDIKNCGDGSGIYKHIIPSMNSVLSMLKVIESRKDELLKERIVRSGPVNNGESWGDFYDCFPKKDDTEVKRLFNEIQKETSFGFYREL